MASDHIRASEETNATSTTPRGAPDPSSVRDGRASSTQPEPERFRAGKEKPAHAEPKDVFREIAETVVFVVVLVLLLKTFTAEAFVIPPGSMAETLDGYQKMVTCPKCGLEFPVNCSSEVDPQDREMVKVTACTCPNCRFDIDI